MTMKMQNRLIIGILLCLLWVPINAVAPTTEQKVLFVNINGPYNADGDHINQTLSLAGADVSNVLLDTNGKVAALLSSNQYDQIWVYDLSYYSDNYPADYAAIANWYNTTPNKNIIADGRIISSYWNGRYLTEGKNLSENYYYNLKQRGGGLLLGTDHYEYSVYGINNINALLGLNPFSGIFYNPTLPVDPLNPLMNTPIDMGAQLFDDSSTGQTPYGLQPNGQILYTVAWHSGNQDTPGISSTLEGVIGLHTTITSPLADSQFCIGNIIILTAQANGGTPAYTYAWSSIINGNLGNGQTLNIDSNSLTPGIHTIRVVATDAAGRIDDDQIQINVSTCQIEPNPINIDLSPDTAINPVGTEHTVTATVNDSNGKPYEGILVVFSIIAGPNSPWNSTGTTNAGGKATFTYTGDGGIGTDSIIAFIDLNDIIESDIVTKKWIAAPTKGSISGMKFNDINGNGIKDSGESGLANWLITLRNSSTGAAIFNTTTANDGSYKFSNLTAGNYTVGEVLQAGWTQTAPVAGKYDVTITDGSIITGKDFGNVELTVAEEKGSISGMKFNDSNGNGTRDTGELGLANWTITLKNETGSMSTEITYANGNYIFTNLTDGNYTVGEVQQNGWTQTAPVTGQYKVTITGGSIITGKDFGNVQTSNKCDKKKYDDDKKKYDDDKKKLDYEKKKYDDDKKKLDNDIKKKADSKTIANDKKKYDDHKKKYDDHKKKHDDDEKKYDDDKKNKCDYDKKKD